MLNTMLLIFIRLHLAEFEPQCALDLDLHSIYFLPSQYHFTHAIFDVSSTFTIPVPLYQNLNISQRSNVAGIKSVGINKYKSI
jgi:hypothetical protein